MRGQCCGFDRAYKRRIRVPRTPSRCTEECTMKPFLGLDIAKDSFYAVLLDGTGQVAQQRSFANVRAGFSQLMAWLPEPRETLAVCEPTGVYGQHLQRAIADCVGSLHEINAQSLRRFSFTQVNTKTDEADALAIAHAARTLHLTRPDLLRQSRVFRDESRDNVVLWLGEYRAPPPHDRGLA